MKSTCPIGSLWAMFEVALAKITRHETSVKAPLASDVLHLRRGACAVVLAMICLVSAGNSAICAALSIVLIHPVGMVLSVSCALIMLSLFSIFIRPPHAERCSNEQTAHLVSPIAIAYLLLIIPASIQNVFGLFSLLFSTIFVMSLLSFEREQVRLYADESTRYKAILVNGELVSDGIPRGYFSSVFGLVIIAIAATPEFLSKMWRTMTENAQAAETGGADQG